MGSAIESIIAVEATFSLRRAGVTHVYTQLTNVDAVKKTHHTPPLIANTRGTRP